MATPHTTPTGHAAPSAAEPSTTTRGSPPPVPRTAAERATSGRQARVARPRQSIGVWRAPGDRPDPVELLGTQESARVPALLPLRHRRTAQTPFAFYRGSALVMASDLSSVANSGLQVRLSGDAHLSNFGLFAAPDRRVVFDLNDYDESHPGPFEWDVLRLCASFVLAGRDNKLKRSVGERAANAAATSYRTSMRANAQRSEIDLWNAREDAADLWSWMRDQGLGRAARRDLACSFDLARTMTTWSAVEKLTEVGPAGRHFLDKPPLLTRIGVEDDLAGFVLGLYAGYWNGLPGDRQELLARYRVIDTAHKVVGVGSVGLPDFVLLLQGRSEQDLIVLQVKAAADSVLAPYTQPSAYPTNAVRIVDGGRLTQADTDELLGPVTAPNGHSFYVRQLRDMKWAPDPATLGGARLDEYGELCGHVLARAHARTGDAVAIAAYLGKGDGFDRAATTFALMYADQVDDDAKAYRAAIASGALASSETVPTAELQAGLRAATIG